MATRKQKSAPTPGKVTEEQPGQRGTRDARSPNSQGASASGKKEKQAPAANDDLVNMALEIQESIRGAYRLHEEHRPVMLFHVQEERIYAYPYLDYKGTLSDRSQGMLEKQYEEAQRRDQIVVFVRDEATRRLVSLSIDYE
jgi:hypothetical protein